MARTPDPERAQARRQAILQAAAQVFAEVGYHSATTRQIAARARVSEGTLYTYFPNKARLLTEMLNVLTQDSISPIPLGNNSSLELLRAILTRTLERPQLTNAMFAAVFSEVLVNASLRDVYREQRLEPMVRDVQHYLERVLPRSPDETLEPAILARITVALLLGLGLLRVLGDPPLQIGSPDLNKVIDNVTTMFREGAFHPSIPDESGGSHASK